MRKVWVVKLKKIKKIVECFERIGEVFCLTLKNTFSY